jgi:peptidoglycan/LPS O-acetylase OafA/YrhL
MGQQQAAPTYRPRLLRDAILTVAVVILAFLAFDDITTDSATSFPAERLTLAVCATWCVGLAWRLLRERRRVIGVLSLGVVAIALWGQRDIGPGTVASWEPHYLAVVVSLGWFLFVAGILANQAWRGRPLPPALG